MDLIHRVTYRQMEGEFLPPWYYGIAFEEYHMAQRVYAIIPLNYAWRLQRWISFRWDKFRSRTPKYYMVSDDNMRLIRDAEYNRGYNAASCSNEIFSSLTRVIRG